MYRTEARKQMQRIRAPITALWLAGLLMVAGCDYFVSPEARLERARVQMARNDHRAALVELKNALQKEPDLHEARLLLVEVALWLGDPMSADAELQRIPSQFQPAAAEDLRARIDIALGRSEALLTRLENATGALSPVQADLYRGLGLLQQPGRAREAEQVLRSVLSRDPQQMSAHSGVLEALAAQGFADRARKLAGELSREHPQSAEIAFAHGMLLARIDVQQARAELERARELSRTQLDVLKRSSVLATLFDAQLAARDVQAASGTSKELSRLTPGAPLAVLISSRVAMASNDYVSAAAELRRLVTAAPKFVQARFMLAVALAAQGNLEQASQELAQVVDQAPQLLEARQLLGQVRLRLNDPDGALRVLVPGIENASDASPLALLVDAARSQAGGDARTIDVFERALADDPENRALETQLATAYLQAGAPAKALALLRKSGSDPADARREALLLQSLLEVEGVAAARARLDALLAGDRSDPRITALVAAFMARHGDIEKARQVLGRELAGQRPPAELYLALARIEWAARRPAAAREALVQLLAREPKYVAARIALAELELASGRPAEARVQLEQARADEPGNVTPRLMLARSALAEGRGGDAELLVDEALKGSAGEVDVHAQAGLMYLESGRYDQAIHHLQAGLKADAGSAPLWLQLGRAQLALNQHGPARESFERALRLRPQWLPAEGALVFLDLQLNASDAAIARVAELKRARPADPAIAALDGQMHLVLRRYADAAAAFDRAGEIRPSGALAAKSYEARLLGRLPNATAPLEHWIAKHPHDLAYRSLLAEAYARSGERGKATEHYERLLEAEPQNVLALNNLAWLYHEIGDSRALDLARRASTAAPDAPAVSDTLGWILVETGRVSEGLPILERAASQAAAEPEIGYHYGAALLKAGHRDKGLAYLRGLLQKHLEFSSRAEVERLTSDAAEGV